MKIKFAVFFLILITAGTITLSGFIGLSDENGHLSCPFSALFGANCLALDDLMTAIIHHLAGLKNIGLAVAGIITVAIVPFLAVSILKIIKQKKSPYHFFKQEKLKNKEFRFMSLHRFLDWFLFREKYDLILSGDF